MPNSTATDNVWWKVRGELFTSKETTAISDRVFQISMMLVYCRSLGLSDEETATLIDRFYEEEWKKEGSK